MSKQTEQMGMQSTSEHPPMELEVKIYPPWKNDRFLATASVSLNGCFAIRGIRIVDGRNGPFVSMPSRQVKSGDKTEYKDICFPCTKEFKQEFDQTILGAYQQYLTQQTEQGRDAPGWTEQSGQSPTPWDGPAMNM